MPMVRHRSGRVRIHCRYPLVSLVLWEAALGHLEKYLLPSAAGIRFDIAKLRAQEVGVGQLGFSDLNRRYDGLNEKNDPLVAIAAMVPFESFRPKLQAALITVKASFAERTRNARVRRDASLGMKS